MSELEEKIEKLSAAIAGLESRRSSLGDAVADPAIAALREQLAQLALQGQNSGAAIGFARALLAENQHPLSEKLLNPIRQACDEWQNGAQEDATFHLASAMDLARDLSYL